MGGRRAYGRPDQRGAGQRDRAALGHRHEVRGPRPEGGIAVGVAEDRRHARDAVARDPDAQEVLALVAAGRRREVRAEQVGQAPAVGIAQHDQRKALAGGEAHDLALLARADLARRAGQHGGVVGDHADLAPVDQAHAGDARVRRRALADLGPVGVREHAELHERAVVDQQRDPLARGAPPAGVVRGDALGPTHGQRECAAALELGQAVGLRDLAGLRRVARLLRNDVTRHGVRGVRAAAARRPGCPRRAADG